jgi:anti-sigma factor RsiW
VTVQFEQRLTSDTDLRRRADAIIALRKNLRAAPVDAAPQNLEARIHAALGKIEARKAPITSRWGWRALAACLCAAVLAGAVLMSIVENNRARGDVAGAVVANHIRGLLASQPFDVASSDRHTVKPWFTARLAESPQVVDLTAEGFLLAGGRIDVIGQQPVATLVYRHGAHLVSLTMLPKDQIVPAATVSGYNAISWHEDGATFVAVCDLPQPDIEAFAQAFRTEAKRL